MYTIKQAAHRSGVSVPLLRAWERRYGIVEPARTQSGYRLYDDISIARLRAMRTLVDDGWTPSLAAAHVLEGGDEAVDLILRDAPPTNGREPVPPAAESNLAGAFVEAARTFDEQRLEAILDEMFGRGSFERVATDHLMPAMVAVGEGWADGRLDVAAEHAASGAVARRLGNALLAAARPGRDGAAVLVGLPPGARHELGALAFATAARRGGLAVHYLGADLPEDHWVEAAEHTRAVAAVIGVIGESDVEAATRVGRALRATRPDLLIAFGGRAAGNVGMREDERTVQLPADIDAAVGLLREAIAAS